MFVYFILVSKMKSIDNNTWTNVDGILKYYFAILDFVDSMTKTVVENVGSSLLTSRLYV